MIAGMTFYQIASYFLVYSFLGWCVEVVFHALAMGKVINRGFLNGPVCPVYGFGVVGVFAFTGLVMPALPGGSSDDAGLGELFLLFLIGMILTTLIELIAGWILDVCFHARWWDYSDRKLNFRGYICLPFSIIWGLAVVIVVRAVQPAMESSRTFHLPPKYGWPVLIILYTVFLADIIVSVLIVAGMNRTLTELDEIQKKMRTVSDGLSKAIGGNTIEAQRKIDESRVQVHLAGAKMRDIKDESIQKLRDRKELLEKRLTGKSWFGAGRILKAFPGLKHERYDDLIRALRLRERGNNEDKG